MLQLELNLWDQLREAEAEPMAIDFQQLCFSFDVAMENMSAKERMEQGAEAIAQLAEVLAVRAESYFESWQQRFDPTGPMLEMDDFSDLVRQSFSLDLEDLIAEPDPTYRLPSDPDLEGGGSIVAEIEKHELLELLEDSMVGSPDLLIEQLESDEDVSAWIGLVRSWMSGLELEWTDMVSIQHGTQLNTVMLWLALLLGGFQLKQEGEFYSEQSLLLSRDRWEDRISRK